MARYCLSCGSAVARGYLCRACEALLQEKLGEVQRRLNSIPARGD